jgi:hypothetical protein
MSSPSKDSRDESLAKRGIVLHAASLQAQNTGGRLTGPARSLDNTGWCHVTGSVGSVGSDRAQGAEQSQWDSRVLYIRSLQHYIVGLLRSQLMSPTHTYL